jgi:hypothetical protein
VDKVLIWLVSILEHVGWVCALASQGGVELIARPNLVRTSVLDTATVSMESNASAILGLEVWH